MTDYVAIRRSDRQDVRIYKTVFVAECCTDRSLLVSKLNIRTQSPMRPQGAQVPKRLNILKLDNSSTKERFEDGLARQLETIDLHTPVDTEANWARLRHLL